MHIKLRKWGVRTLEAEYGGCMRNSLRYFGVLVEDSFVYAVANGEDGRQLILTEEVVGEVEKAVVARVADGYILD